LRVNAIPVPREVELADDALVKQAAEVRGSRELEAGEDLLGRARAAEHRASLQDEDAPAGARQVRRRHQPVMPAADDERVPDFGHRGFHKTPPPEQYRRCGDSCSLLVAGARCRAPTPSADPSERSSVLMSLVPN